MAFRENPFKDVDYSVVADLTAPGLAVIISDLACADLTCRPDVWIARASDPRRFMLATAVEALARGDEWFFSSRFPTEDAAQVYRAASQAFLEDSEDLTLGAIHSLNPANFDDFFNADSGHLTASTLRELVASGWRLVSVDIQVPVVHLRAIARQLGLPRGKGTDDIKHIDPFLFHDSNTGEGNSHLYGTDLEVAQSRQNEGWVMLAIPPSTSVGSISRLLERLHRDTMSARRDHSKVAAKKLAAALKRRLVEGQRNEPGCLGNTTPWCPSVSVFERALAMDLSNRSTEGWNANGIVPLFDLLAWRKTLAYEKQKNKKAFGGENTIKTTFAYPISNIELAMWLWGDDDTVDDLDSKFKKVRNHLEVALAVHNRLQRQVLATWPIRGKV